ncbi:hypothetical protein NC661_14705 [Aquibacillus koreensis]|uniref:Uncharacterized protein n=1 Tax=Aquibacillus koreensis TaxID=279446 RepID=A0A9X3WQ96_9BACI|nr:hypothetical protein [Aquibacillus koreensis]MCT2537274.1 hypothetical protein [Aquibacillus koreensis]MDC3421621.1 hypothetical protein [Aquibacillus koreensis]
MKSDELGIDLIHQKLEQHEHTITQLLAIIAINNKKITELSRRQAKLEQIAMDQTPFYFSNSSHRVPPISPNTFQKNK